MARAAFSMIGECVISFEPAFLSLPSSSSSTMLGGRLALSWVLEASSPSITRDLCLYFGKSEEAVWLLVTGLNEAERVWACCPICACGGSVTSIRVPDSSEEIDCLGNADDRLLDRTLIRDNWGVPGRLPSAAFSLASWVAWAAAARLIALMRRLARLVGFSSLLITSANALLTEDIEFLREDLGFASDFVLATLLVVLSGDMIMGSFDVQQLVVSISSQPSCWPRSSPVLRSLFVAVSDSRRRRRQSPLGAHQTVRQK